MSNTHSEFKKGKTYFSRTMILFGLQVFCFLMLFVRLFYLQIVNFEKYIDMSEKNRIKILPTPPLRGNILDRNGEPLTDNRRSYRVLLYQNRRYNRTTVKNLAEVLELSEAELGRIKRRLEKQAGNPIISLMDNLSWEELAKVESNAYMLEGISIESGHIRQYNYGELFAHTIGYVSAFSEGDTLEKGINREMMLHPDYKIGRSGLEYTMNRSLTGQSGYRKVEVNALGIPLRDLLVLKNTEGKDIRLTLDLGLQQEVARVMDGKRGAVVLMDVNTGEILAMYSAPSYNPNNFVEGISTEYWTQLNNDVANPLTNKTIGAIYPPGSTFKPAVALAALEAGQSPDRRSDCRGVTFMNNRDFHCSNKRKHGNVNMEEAIKVSCNIYFGRLAESVGIDQISETALAFGLGQTYDMGLQGMQSGLVPTKDWKRTRHNDVWVRGDTINVGIGQGFTLTTPLQLAVMVSRIGNGGFPVEPFLIYDSEMREENLKLFKNESNRIARKENIDVIKNGMYAVVNEPGGTAYWRRIYNKKHAMAGKTGTAQVIAKGQKDLMEERGDEVEERYRDHALFIAFAPFDKPKYAIAVVVEHGGGGSSVAAPVARDILEFIQIRDDEIAGGETQGNP